MNKDSSNQSGGIGFIGLLTVAFIVLKLTNVISWSWWWVLSPLWIVAGIVVIVLIGAILAVIVKEGKAK
jgi:hypothetical protein